jgi:hypothetical protein
MVFVPLRVESTTVVGRLNLAEELLFSTLNSSMVSRPGGRRKALRDGYSVAEEAPISVLIFGLPAAAGLLVRWKFS